MNLSMISKEKDKLTIRVKDVGAGYINTMRRLMMTEVPVLAIEDVEFRKNSSALYDEIVAHRLGMLSIKTDLKSYNLPKECKCKGAGCAQCQVKFTLKAVGPKTVYAEELKSKDPKIVPIFGKAPIVKLLEGQELEFEATAVLGQGIVHTKWNACLAYYKEYPHVQIKKQPENAKELAKKYPFALEIKSGKLVVKEKAIPLYDVYEAIAAESKGVVKIDYKDDYIMYIESWQQLPPKEIVSVALNRFDLQLEEIKKLLKEV